MPTVPVFVSDPDCALLSERARQLGVDPLALAENIIRWYFHGTAPPPEQRVPDAVFREAMERTLTENAELYRRLAESEAAERRQ